MTFRTKHNYCHCHAIPMPSTVEWIEKCSIELFIRENVLLFLFSIAHFEFGVVDGLEINMVALKGCALHRESYLFDICSYFMYGSMCGAGSVECTAQQRNFWRSQNRDVINHLSRIIRMFGCHSLRALISYDADGEMNQFDLYDERALRPHYACFGNNGAAAKCYAVDVFGIALSVDERDVNDWKFHALHAIIQMSASSSLSWMKFLFLGEHTHAPGHISAIFVFSLGERVLYALFRMHIVHGLQISRAHEFYDGIHLWDSTIHFMRSRVAGIEWKLASSQNILMHFCTVLLNYVMMMTPGTALPFIEMFLIINFPNSTFIASNASNGYYFDFIYFFSSSAALLQRAQSVWGKTINRSGNGWLSLRLPMQLEFVHFKWIVKNIACRRMYNSDGDDDQQKGEARPSRFNWNVGHICIWKVFVRRHCSRLPVVGWRA